MVNYNLAVDNTWGSEAEFVKIIIKVGISFIVTSYFLIIIIIVETYNVEDRGY